MEMANYLLPSCGSAFRSGSLADDTPSGISVPMQTDQTPQQSMSSNSLVVPNGNNKGATKMVPTRYYTRQNAPPTSEVPVEKRSTLPSWVLIEWDKPSGTPNSYAVIASTKIVARAPDRRDQAQNGRRMQDSELYTGNLIHVKRGDQILPATIVMVSEDKKFIETELRQLRNIATNNLNTKSDTTVPVGQNQQQLHTVDNHPEQRSQGQAFRNETEQTMQMPERRQHVTFQHHVEAHDTVYATKRQRKDSMSSFTERSSMSPSSSEVSTSEKSVAIGQERVIAPRTNRTVRPHVVRPMTFDQQTQTIGLAFSGLGGGEAQLGKILSYLESVLAEQKSCRMEREYDRKLLHDLHEKLVMQEATLKRIEEKADSWQKQNYPDQPKQLKEPNNESKNVIETGGLIDRFLVADESGKLHGGYRTDPDGFVEVTNNLKTVVNSFQLDANSNQSWSSCVGESAKGLKTTNGNGELVGVISSDALTTSDNGYVVIDTAENYAPSSLERTARRPKENVGKGKRYQKSLGARRTEKAATPQSVSIDELTKDWDDPVGDEELEKDKEDARTSPTLMIEIMPVSAPEEMVSIGANGTLVRQQALQKIKWSNYKSATRKLLMEVFGREMLATHSLSGRPSPALRADTEKPVKDRLEATMVADVMEIVSKMCNVDNCMIRNVITAKCADENKMRKQRAAAMDPMRSVTPKAAALNGETETILAIVDNKENIC